MTTTRAAVLTEHGKPLLLQDIQLPEPAAADVPVTMEFAGVNPIDRYNAIGSVAPGTPLPRILGVEGAGRLADGTRVLINGEGVGSARDGTWSRLAVIPRAALVEIPDGVSQQVAACVGVAGLTAWGAVALKAEVTSADTVLVLGAGGGVGLAVVSLAASRGARVIGQVGPSPATSASKAAAVTAAGAHSAVTSDAAGLHAAIAAIAARPELTPTVVIDPLGGDFTGAAISLLAEQGRYVVFGTSAGAEISLNWQQVYRKGLTLHGLGNALFTTTERHQHLTDTLAAVARGEMIIPIDRVVPLEDVNVAFAALADRSVIGKVVLDLTGG